jgi:membrane fusion protein (multidrug efflux system)
MSRRVRRPFVPPLAVVVVLLAVACGGSDDAGEVEFRVPVTVQEVGTDDVEDRIVATGTVRAVETVSLSVERTGVLDIARDADGRRLGEGSRVAAGQTVAEITGEDVRLAARTQASRLRWEAARRDHDATAKLVEQGILGALELEKAEAALEEALLEYDRSRHTEQRNRLVTPIDGVILHLARDAQGQPLASGQLVAAGLLVAQVAPLDPLVAEVDVVGADVARVREGLEARVRHHAWPDERFAGRVVRLAPTIDAVTRALRAEVEVDNRAGLLRPGMFVEVTLVAEHRQGVPVVPREAVADRGGKRVLFILRGQRVARRDVVLGLGDDRQVEIRDGVEPGERVVVRGLETLTDGTRVRVTGG